jgi:hypothetical protein
VNLIARLQTARARDHHWASCSTAWLRLKGDPSAGDDALLSSNRNILA